VGTKEGTVSVADLHKAGVKRISMGVALYTRVMADLKVAANSSQPATRPVRQRAWPSARRPI
jgi:2-methylisocitrate lyase-like PEP mutase family enzyme